MRCSPKSQRAVDLLLMKFISVIHDKTYAVVAMYVEVRSDIGCSLYPFLLL